MPCNRRSSTISTWDQCGDPTQRNPPKPLQFFAEGEPLLTSVVRTTLKLTFFPQIKLPRRQFREETRGTPRPLEGLTGVSSLGKYGRRSLSANPRNLRQPPFVQKQRGQFAFRSEQETKAQCTPCQTCDVFFFTVAMIGLPSAALMLNQPGVRFPDAQLRLFTVCW